MLLEGWAAVEWSIEMTSLIKYEAVALPKGLSQLYYLSSAAATLYSHTDEASNSYRDKQGCDHRVHIQGVPGGMDKLEESVPYVKIYRYNPKHLYPKLNGYGDNGQRSLKV